jgi:hypothetical protein
MALSWKEFWDRYNFFKAKSNEGPARPESITSPFETPRPQEFTSATHNELQSMINNDFGAMGLLSGLNYTAWIANNEQSKELRSRTYRDMETNSWICDGLDEYVTTAHNQNDKGESILLKIKKKEIEASPNISENLRKEFEHIRDDIIGYDVSFPIWFREFALMGELAIEQLVEYDNIELVKRGICGIKMLRSEQYVVYHNMNDEISGFIVKNMWDESIRTVVSKDQIAYVDSGVFDYVDRSTANWAEAYIPTKGRYVRLPRSFLDSAKKPFKQLDALEDSLVVYRLARSPERLVFNVASGNLPKNKAEEYLHRLVNKYRKKLSYNPSTGEVDQAQNVKNLLEDFWFIKDAAGKGTDVSSIGSGLNLGEVDDLQYIREKLYAAMKIPRARARGEAVFEQTPGSINMEEVKFQRWIYHILRRFSAIIKQIYINHLKIKGIWDYYHLTDRDIDVEAIPPSYFVYMKNAEFMDAQFARFSSFMNNVDTETPLFARKTALKEGLGWSDEKIDENERRLAEEKRKKTNEVEEGGVASDAGGLGSPFGGGNMGGGLGGGGGGMGSGELGGLGGGNEFAGGSMKGLSPTGGAASLGGGSEMGELPDLGV